MNDAGALAPLAYADFRCIGEACEDHCCQRWAINIDRRSFADYRRSTHPQLQPLFAAALQRNPKARGEQDYGRLTLAADGACPMLDARKLCRIHAELGPGALSTTCASFPRQASRCGDEFEYALDLSCPEAARMVLLDPAPMAFAEVARDPRLELLATRRPRPEKASAELLNDLRALVIGLLQQRQAGIETRLWLLGKLIRACAAAGGPAGLPAAIGEFLGVFDELPAIEQEMAALRPDPVQRARLFRAILAELRHDCQDGPLRELYGEAMAGLGFSAAAGEDFAALAGRHAAIASAAVLPFEQRQPQLAEHYLVSQVFQSRFPLRSPDLLAQYRELACLHLVCRCFMFGLAGHHGGIDEALAIRFHHALSRIVAHSPDYLAQLAPALQRRLDIDVQSLLLLVALRP